MTALGASQPELSWTEAHLVDAAREGDERAFGELYARYGRRIFAYVLGMVRDHNRAEDVAQDVFVSALRRMRSSDCAISFKPWIYEIAKNACIDEFRRAGRSREVSLEHGRGEQLVSTRPSPDTCFEQRQQLDALHGAFRGLSERQHTVIVLRELEGLSYTEIAARTGMTLPMVESTLMRARRRLSQEYDDIASGRRCEQVVSVIEAGGQAAVDALGLRERRRFARHISHCQPCARHARTAAITPPQTRVPALVKKVAGLLPFPVARWALPWDGHGKSGSHPLGLLRSARRAAQLFHPGASAGLSPATVATMAVVIAGGGAAAGLLSLGHAPGVHHTHGTAAARPAAVTRAPRAAPRGGVSTRRGQPAPAPVRSRSGRAARAAGSTAERTTRSHNGVVISAASAQKATAAGSTAAATQPSVPSTPGSAPSPPQGQSSVPVPSVPAPLSGGHLLHGVTGSLGKVVKKPGQLPVPPLPGPLGLPSSLLGTIGGT
jgi:RNA polymerase sigma factor (sigma-70 family)